MLGNSLSRFRDMGLLIIRIGVGVAFIAHGWPKITGGKAGWEQLGAAFPVPVAVVWGFIAALVETLGGLFFAIGFLFRPVSFLLFFQMMVAINAHLHMKPPMNTFAMGWSHAFELGILCLGLMFVGPGRFSVDAGLGAELSKSSGASNVE